jgi:hypothetical protein
LIDNERQWKCTKKETARKKEGARKSEAAAEKKCEKGDFTTGIKSAAAR